MTKQIKSAIENLKEVYPKKCQMVDGRLTGGFDDYESEKGKAITLAIRSLEAWDEVIEELEEELAFEDSLGNDEAIVELDMCILLINQKLKEVEECTKAL